jgi:hypothetical protein
MSEDIFPNELVIIVNCLKLKTHDREHNCKIINN